MPLPDIYTDPKKLSDCLASPDKEDILLTSPEPKESNSNWLVYAIEHDHQQQAEIILKSDYAKLLMSQQNPETVANLLKQATDKAILRSRYLPTGLGPW